MILGPDIGLVTCDMCAFGLRITDPEGEALVRKRSRLMSNSPEILKRLNKQCTNDMKEGSKPRHRHADTASGRSKACQVYPTEFCRAVCAGTAAQKKIRNLGVMPLELMSIEEMKEAAGGVPGRRAARERRGT